MTIGVVVPCYRQERFLPRTLAALERALAGLDWRGALVLSAPGESAPLPELSERWQVVRPAHGAASRALTPGAARNAGFEVCGGTWVLFVDADVELESPWLARALGECAGEERVAGLWGRIEEWFVQDGRERPGSADMYRVGEGDHDSDYLATLSFYRRAALAEVGAYHAGLSSEEDFELGLRLRRAGWRMRSLAPLAARHWSGPRPSFAEIGRRWRTRLCFGQGQALRLYLGRPGFADHLERQRLYLGTLAFYLALPAMLVAGLGSAWAGAAVGAFIALWLRKRSPRLALHSLLMWTVNTAGMIVGFVVGPGPTAERAEAA